MKIIFLNFICRFKYFLHNISKLQAALSAITTNIPVNITEDIELRKFLHLFLEEKSWNVLALTNNFTNLYERKISEVFTFRINIGRFLCYISRRIFSFKKKIANKHVSYIYINMFYFWRKVNIEQVSIFTIVTKTTLSKDS